MVSGLGIRSHHNEIYLNKINGIPPYSLRLHIIRFTNKKRVLLYECLCTWWNGTDEFENFFFIIRRVYWRISHSYYNRTWKAQSYSHLKFIMYGSNATTFLISFIQCVYAYFAFVIVTFVIDYCNCVFDGFGKIFHYSFMILSIYRVAFAHGYSPFLRDMRAKCSTHIWIYDRRSKQSVGTWAFYVSKSIRNRTNHECKA